MEGWNKPGTTEWWIYGGMEERYSSIPELSVAFFDGVFDKVGGLFDIQLDHHIRTMAFHRADANKKKISNLSIRFPLGNQL